MTPGALTWDVWIKVVTPLHIGNGERWLPGFDFVERRGPKARTVLVLDVARMLENGEELVAARAASGMIADALPLNRRAEYTVAEYAVSGRENVDRINAMMRDADGRPYVPGSSLKGAIRTQMLRALASPDRVAAAMEGLPSLTPFQRRRAALGGLEQSAFNTNLAGRDFPNSDMNRLLQVADMLPVGKPAVAICKASAYSIRNPDAREIPIWCESVMPRGKVDFQGRVSVQAAGPLWDSLTPAQKDALRQLPMTLSTQAAALAQLEADEWKISIGKKATPVIGFYQNAIIGVAKDASQVVPLQVGGGGGWNSKTIAPLLSPEQRAAAGTVLRSRKAMGRRYADDDSFRADWGADSLFPSTRRLASFVERHEDGSEIRHDLPPGWLYLTMKPVTG